MINNLIVQLMDLIVLLCKHVKILRIKLHVLLVLMDLVYGKIIYVINLLNVQILYIQLIQSVIQ